MSLALGCKKYQILCHLPNGSTVFGVRSKRVYAYSSLCDIPPEASGFIVAPFQPSVRTPVFLFEDIKTDRLPLPDPASTGHGHTVCTSDQEAYATAFDHIKYAIASGTVRKVVLARSETVSGTSADTTRLFAIACRTYPDCYTALMAIPGHGIWLTATPELLYQTHNGTGKTTALAGTMAWTDAENGIRWTTKDSEEQKIVSDYIRSKFAQNSISFSEGTPHTVKAGNLAHIQTDFTLQPDSNSAIEILRLLHPTPAVAGVPQEDAVKTIQEAEGKDFRKYYAGFSGFLNCHGEETACFVSLRLMHMKADSITLYAGGGILAQSSMQNEWNETVQKLDIMKRLLDFRVHVQANVDNHV